MVKLLLETYICVFPDLVNCRKVKIKSLKCPLLWCTFTEACTDSSLKYIIVLCFIKHVNAINL